MSGPLKPGDIVLAVNEVEHLWPDGSFSTRGPTITTEGDQAWRLPLPDAVVERLAKRAKLAYWDELNDATGWAKVVRAIFTELLDGGS
jgi:hypothetical protein